MSAAQIVTAICNFFSIALIARMLGPVLQGQWTLYINAFTFGTIALGFGLPPAINHFIAAGKMQKKLVVGQFFVFSVVVAGIFLLGTYCISLIGLKEIMLPSVLPASYIIGGLSIHFMLLIFNQLLTSTLLAERRFQSAALVTIVGAVVLLIGYLFFYYGLDADTAYFKYFILFNLFVLGLQCILYLWHILRLINYSFQFAIFSKPVLTMLFSFAAWAYITNFLQFLNYRIDVWFIEAYQDNDAQLGIYSIAVSLSQLIWLLPNAFHTIIFTDISAQGDSITYKKIRKWSINIFFLALGLALAGYLLSFWLVPLLFTEAYIDVVTVFPFLLPGIVVFAPSILLSAYFAGIKRVDINFQSSGLGFVACILMNIILIPKFGIIGAAAASSVSYIVSSLYLIHRYVMAKSHI